jgi:hypothetical protein
MDEKQKREEFDTGLGKIRHEIKSQLVPHGFFGSVTYTEEEPFDDVPTGSKIEIAVKGRTVERSFSRKDIEGCRLRVGGAVLSGIISMVDELATSPETRLTPG